MAEADAPATDGGVLSVDEGVAALRASRSEPVEAAAEPVEPVEGDAEPVEGAEEVVEPAEGDTPVAEEPAEGEEIPEGEGEPVEALEPPQFWKAEWKDKFATFPKEAQEILLAQEKERDTLLSTATTKANTARAALEAEATQIAERKAQIDDLLPRAKATFASRWETVDWDAVQDQYGAEETLKLQRQAGREQAELQALEKAQREAQDTELKTFVREQREALKTVAPELADPKEGQTRRQAVVSFLESRGFTDLNRLTAEQAAIAYDAMRYRQAKAAIVPAPKPAPTPARPSIRPSAAPARATPQRSLDAARERVDRTGSIDDGVALLRAQRKG